LRNAKNEEQRYGLLIWKKYKKWIRVLTCEIVFVKVQSLQSRKFLEETTFACCYGILNNKVSLCPVAVWIKPMQ